MKAALNVFARRGIIGTKMNMIAAEAGISHGLLYHYFKSKDELFITLVEGAMIEADDEMKKSNLIPGSPIERIRKLTEIILDEEGAPYFMLIHQARTADGVPDKAKALVQQYSMKSFVERLLPLFLEAQDKGEIVSGDPAMLISSYLSVLSGLMILNAQDDAGFRIPETEFLLRMLTGR